MQQTDIDLVSAVIKAVALYSVREAQEGFAKVIQIDVDGLTFRVADDGRGHAVDRTVDGEPYLKFVYEHLAFPFDQHPPPTVQLHVIGMSLVNAMCRELTVEARKETALVRLRFRNGLLVSSERLSEAHRQTGNTISGVLIDRLAGAGADVLAVKAWLADVKASLPHLTLVLNGTEIDQASG